MDGGGRQFGAGRILHQSVYWSSARLRAAGDRRHDAEPRRQFFARSEGAEHLAPGRLPFHTLNPALAVLKDGRVMAYGTMGGDGQPQSQAAVHPPRALPPAARQGDRRAALAARAHLGLVAYQPADGIALRRQPGRTAVIGAVTMSNVLPEGYSDTMGHAGAAILSPNGTMEAAHDPRADGGAAGV